MMPSMPRLRTPARSEMSSPKVAKINGEAMRMAAAQRVAENRISTASIALFPAQAITREHKPRDHGEKRRRNHYLRDVARHLGAAAHCIGADENSGDEDRRGDDTQRMKQCQHGDDNAGIAEARRQIEGEIALEASHLREAGEARKSARQQRRLEHDAIDL